MLWMLRGKSGFSPLQFVIISWSLFLTLFFLRVQPRRDSLSLLILAVALCPAEMILKPDRLVSPGENKPVRLKQFGQSVTPFPSRGNEPAFVGRG